MSRFWKPGEAKPADAAPVASGAASKHNSDDRLSNRTMTMRFMLRGQEAETLKKTEAEKARREAAARWVARHGASQSDASGSAAATSAPAAAASQAAGGPAAPRFRVTYDRDTTAPQATDGTTYLQSNAAVWSSRVSYGGANKSLEINVKQAVGDKAKAPDFDEVQMANFQARVQGRAMAQGASASGDRGPGSSLKRSRAQAAGDSDDDEDVRDGQGAVGVPDDEEDGGGGVDEGGHGGRPAKRKLPDSIGKANIHGGGRYTKLFKGAGSGGGRRSGSGHGGGRAGPGGGGHGHSMGQHGHKGGQKR